MERVTGERRRIIGGGNDAWAISAALAAEDELFRRLGLPEPDVDLSPQQKKVVDKAYSVALNAVRAMLADALEHGQTTADLLALAPPPPDDSVCNDQAVADVAVRVLLERMTELDLSVADMVTYLEKI